MPQLYAFINNGAKKEEKKQKKRQKKNDLENFCAFAEMKSETLISLQSNSIVSSGFNRTQMM